MNTDIVFFGKYVNGIEADLARIEADPSSLNTHQEELRKHTKHVDSVVAKFNELMDDKRKRKPEAFTQENQTKIDAFLVECASLVHRLKTVFETYEMPVNTQNKKTTSKPEKATSTKETAKKNTKRKAKTPSQEKEKEKQEKLLAKEKEKQLAKERSIATKKQKAVFDPEQILNDKVSIIAFRNLELQRLTNTWPCLVTITEKDDVYQYNSGEHAFQGEKYRRLAKASKNTARKAELLRYSKQFLRSNDEGITATDAKERGPKLTAEELGSWEKLSLKVQREINQWKSTIAEVRDDLSNTGNRILVQEAPLVADTTQLFWEGKATVNEKGQVEVLGKNWLGRIWMEVRDKMNNNQ
jgi:predicted NAD-dependent protein-ADP-ribosyltransferase YbiA (DUF1768 family)